MSNRPTATAPEEGLKERVLSIIEEAIDDWSAQPRPEQEPAMAQGAISALILLRRRVRELQA